VSEPTPLVLIVEDDRQMRRFLRTTLAALEYRLVEAQTIAEGLAAVTTHNPDVILMDLGLPDGDGIDLTRKIRTWSRTPIIVISARGREEDKVAALDEGADDYLTKPFGVNELLARIRAAMRRSAATSPGADAAVLEVGSLHIDQARREVKVGDREVRLTPIEYRLLVLLAGNAGKVSPTGRF
jgi:two-component system KDP operon response regulator KdpE